MRIKENDFQIGVTDCPPESGGQRDREADPARGGSKTGIFTYGSSGTTPALRATPPDSGGELLCSPYFNFTFCLTPQDRGTVHG
jgi:hypothetical protein